MIITHDSSIENNTNLKSQAFGIQQSAYLFKVLYSSMYEDKEQVVLGELAANGLDAHTAAGIPETPIKIALPTSLSPYLVVTDTGVGMSLETIETVFPVYGNSTKRDSNNPIGGFGYGCKSPFALSSSFTVESNHNGFKTVASCYLDEGEPKFSIFVHKETDEPNGTQIKVPVSDPTIQSRLAEKAMYIFILWDVRPEIVGFPSDSWEHIYNSDDRELYRTEDYVLLDHKAISRHPSYSSIVSTYYHTQDKPTLVGVGPYMYKLPANILNAVLNSETWDTFKTYMIPERQVLLPIFAIGELELSPTRESIEDTKANQEIVEARYKAILESNMTSNDVDPVSLLEATTDIAYEGEKLSDHFTGVPADEDVVLKVDDERVAACLAKLLDNASPLASTYAKRLIEDVMGVVKTLKRKARIVVPHEAFVSNYLDSQYVSVANMGAYKSQLQMAGFDTGDPNRANRLYYVNPFNSEFNAVAFMRTVRKYLNVHLTAYSIGTRGVVRAKNLYNEYSLEGSKVVIVPYGDDHHTYVRDYVKHSGDSITVIQLENSRIKEFTALLSSLPDRAELAHVACKEIVPYADVVSTAETYRIMAKEQRKAASKARKSGSIFTARKPKQEVVFASAYTVKNGLEVKSDIFATTLKDASFWANYEFVVLVKTSNAASWAASGAIPEKFAELWEKVLVLSIPSSKYSTARYKDFVDFLSTNKIAHTHYTASTNFTNQALTYYRYSPSTMKLKTSWSKLSYVAAKVLNGLTYSEPSIALYSGIIEGTKLPELTSDMVKVSVPFTVPDNVAADIRAIVNNLPVLTRVVVSGIRDVCEKDTEALKVLTTAQKQQLQGAIRAALKSIEYN